MEVGFLGWYFPVPFIDFSTMGMNSLKSFTTEDERALIFHLRRQLSAEQGVFQCHQLCREKVELFTAWDYRAEATFYNNLGYIHFLRGDYLRAWEYYRRSLGLCEKNTPSPTA